MTDAVASLRLDPNPYHLAIRYQRSLGGSWDSTRQHEHNEGSAVRRRSVHNTLSVSIPSLPSDSPFLFPNTPSSPSIGHISLAFQNRTVQLFDACSTIASSVPLAQHHLTITTRHQVARIRQQHLDLRRHPRSTNITRSHEIVLFHLVPSPSASETRLPGTTYFRPVLRNTSIALAIIRTHLSLLRNSVSPLLRQLEHSTTRRSTIKSWTKVLAIDTSHDLYILAGA